MQPIEKEIKIFNHYSGMSLRQRMLVDQINLSNINKNDKIICNIFNTDKDNKVLNSDEINSVWNTIQNYASLDGNEKELSSNEILELLKNVKDNKQKSLYELGMTPKNFIDFINKYFLNEDTKFNNPQYAILAQKLGVNVDISNKISKEQYDNELIPALINYTKDVNLYNSNTNETVSDLNEVISTYIQKYGDDLHSTSREILLTGTSTEESGHLYDNIRFNRNKTLSQNDLVIKNNFANCGEAQDLILDILRQNFPDKYTFNAFDIKYKSKRNEGNDCHCAVLITDKNNEEYVIDMWINPKGGLYKRSDWEQKMSEIFNFTKNEYITYTTDK